MPEEEWIDIFNNEDNNTGRIAPTLQPKPSSKTNDSEVLPD